MDAEFLSSFSDEAMAQFTSISGDVNPLHLDREYAGKAGFQAPVVYGMLTSSLYSQLVGVYLPGQYALLQGIDIDFHAACYIGDQLRVHGEIVFLSDACQRIEIKASIRNQDRKLISNATIRVGLYA